MKNLEIRVFRGLGARVLCVKNLGVFRGLGA